MHEPLLIALGFVAFLLALVCVFLVMTLMRLRRAPAATSSAKAKPHEGLITGVDVPHPDEENAELTLVKPFLPSLAEGDDDDATEHQDDSKAILLFEDESLKGVDEPTGPVNLVLTTAAGLTDRGLVRRRNEDSFLVDPKLDLYVVADGMGGYAGGDVASRLAVNAVQKAITTATTPRSRPEYPRRGDELMTAVENANAAIYAEAQARRDLKGMGTTLLAARFSLRKKRVYIAHVGDSRAYRFRAGNMRMLTTDHTLAARGVTGPMATNIRRAVGIATTVKVDLIVDKLLPEDTYVLCSDGLFKMVGEEQIRRILEQQNDAGKAASALVAAANAGGGRDNVTVVVVRVQDVSFSSWSSPPRVASA